MGRAWRRGEEELMGVGVEFREDIAEGGCRIAVDRLERSFGVDVRRARVERLDGNGGYRAW